MPRGNPWKLYFVTGIAGITSDCDIALVLCISGAQDKGTLRMYPSLRVQQPALTSPLPMLLPLATAAVVTATATLTTTTAATALTVATATATKRRMMPDGSQYQIRLSSSKKPYASYSAISTRQAQPRSRMSILTFFTAGSMAFFLEHDQRSCERFA